MKGRPRFLHGRGLAPPSVLTLLLVALVLVGACVEGDQRAGAQVTVVLEVQGEPGESLPHDLGVVLDHVELRTCVVAPRSVGSRAMRRVARWVGGSSAHAAHLPPAPHRLLTGAAWSLLEGGRAQPAWEAGVLEPPLQSWCGARFAFLAATAGSAAANEGVPVGRSLWARFAGPEPRWVVGSLGFEVAAGQGEETVWLPGSALAAGPLVLTLSIDLERLSALLRDMGSAQVEAGAAGVAQALLNSATLRWEPAPQ